MMKIETPTPFELYEDTTAKETDKITWETLKTYRCSLWVWEGILFRVSAQVRITSGATGSLRILLNGAPILLDTTTSETFETKTSKVRSYLDYSVRDSLSEDVFEFQLKTSDSTKKAYLGTCKVEISHPAETFARKFEDRESIQGALGTSILIDNSLNQDVSIQIKANREESTTGAINIGTTITVTAGKKGLKTLVPQTDGWLPWIFCTAQCSTAPTSGSLSVWRIRSKENQKEIFDVLEIRDTKVHTGSVVDW